jgi:hypothetical protein
MFQRWMILDSPSEPEDFAITLDLTPERFCPVERLASLGKHFDAAAVLDLIFGHYALPQRLAIRANAAWRLRLGCSDTWDKRHQRLFCHKIRS